MLSSTLSYDIRNDCGVLLLCSVSVSGVINVQDSDISTLSVDRVVTPHQSLTKHSES